MVNTSNSAEQRTSRRRKITAILTGGLVLGFGAAVTLAAWNDSEFATGTFTAGSFTFQGSTDGTTFTDHASEAGAAGLTFSAPFDNLAPNEDVYAPFALKLTGSNDASVTAEAPVATGDLSGALTFGAVETATFGCDASAFDGGTALADPIVMEPDDVVNLCLKVTAGAITQDKSATVLWEWAAESAN